MKHGKVTTALYILGFLLFAGGALATEELAEKETLVCTACHDKPGSKLLTDEGKFYELMRTMDGYADLEVSFGKCTFCHRRKPGSKKLTKAGKGFALALGSMEELVEWVRMRHPEWPEVTEEDLLSPEIPSESGTTPGDGPPTMIPSH